MSIVVVLVSFGNIVWGQCKCVSQELRERVLLSSGITSLGDSIPKYVLFAPGVNPIKRIFLKASYVTAFLVLSKLSMVSQPAPMMA